MDITHRNYNIVSTVTACFIECSFVPSLLVRLWQTLPVIILCFMFRFSIRRIVGEGLLKFMLVSSMPFLFS